MENDLDKNFGELGKKLEQKAWWGDGILDRVGKTAMSGRIPKLMDNSDMEKNYFYRQYLLDNGFQKINCNDDKHYWNGCATISVCFTPCTFGVNINGAKVGRVSFETFKKLVQIYIDNANEQLQRNQASDESTD